MYIEPALRKRGIGRALVEAAEARARDQRCGEIASDAEFANAASLAAHQALGYQED